MFTRDSNGLFGMPLVTHSTQSSLIQEIGGKEKRNKARKKRKEKGEERRSKDNLFPILESPATKAIRI